jgi:predicted nucleic-acid-binding Zn-ribbon protein
VEEYQLSNERCPKCDSKNVDKGNIGSGLFGYKSIKQGFFSGPVKEFEAKVCLDCGYIEMYINVEKLKKK